VAKEIVGNRQRLVDLVLYKTYAELRAEAAKTYINYLWWVIDPILGMLVFYVVFGILFDRSGEDYVAFLLIGVVVWNWYRQTIGHAGNAIVNGKGLINQVWVPKIVFPIVTVLMDTTKFVVVFTLLVTFLLASGAPVGKAYLALPIIMLVQFLMIASLAVTFAAIVPYIPDLRFVVDNLLNLQFFLSGIFFAVHDVPSAFQGWFLMNPTAALIVSYRRVLLDGSWPLWLHLGWIIAGSVLLLSISSAWLRIRDQDYPRLLSQ